MGVDAPILLVHYPAALMDYSAATLTEQDPRRTKVWLWIIASDGIIGTQK